MADAGSVHLRDELGGGLGLGVEEGVAAADVGEEGVAFAGAVGEIDAGVFRRGGRRCGNRLPLERVWAKTQCSMWNMGMC